MRVLIGCEFSGLVREAFKAKGHDAWSCDLLESEIPGQHYQCDIKSPEIWEEPWDLLIAHPPCTRLANSGVHWLARRNLWDELDEAAEFFKFLLLAPIEKIAIENPIPHKYAIERIGQKYTQIIQPYEYGHDASKRTCLWLKNLDLLVPTNIIPASHPGINGRLVWGNQTPSGQNKLGPSATRALERSKTYTGIAQAFADTWG